MIKEDMDKQKNSSREAAEKVLEEAFKQFDTDKSGSIQPHELRKLMDRLTDHFHVENPSKEDVEEIFQELDTNGDRKISQEEFKVLIVEVLNIIQEEKKKLKANQ